MKKEENNLESLKGKNPFTVPDGYFEGLTSQIMSQLPEQSKEKAKQVSLMDRVRPWLYMAAVFASLGLFFKAIMYVNTPDPNAMPDSLLVQTEAPADSFATLQTEEDQEYLEYIEAQYTNYLLAEELVLSE